MNVTVNGEDHALDQKMTVEQFLGQIGINPKKVAVERNLEIVPKSQFDQTELSDGDKLEIVHFIGGG